MLILQIDCLIVSASTARLGIPELLICSDCDAADFTAPETELRLFGKDDVAAAGGMVLCSHNGAVLLTV